MITTKKIESLRQLRREHVFREALTKHGMTVEGFFALTRTPSNTELRGRIYQAMRDWRGEDGSTLSLMDIAMVCRVKNHQALYYPMRAAGKAE